MCGTRPIVASTFHIDLGRYVIIFIKIFCFGLLLNSEMI